MAVQTTGSITSEALARLTDLHFNEREAKLKAERASATKSIEGRQILPGVMAELAQLKQKEAERKRKIEEAGQKGQPSPQSMMPPLTEVTGMSSGRSPAQAMKSASEIFQQVSGGGGIKSGMIGTIAGQQAPPQQAPQPQTANTNIGQPTQTVPSGINLGQGPPGSVVQITRDLPWWEQGLYGLGAIAGRNVGLGITAIRGEEVIGTRQIPTLDQQAKPLVPGLSALISKSHSTSPELAAAAQKELDARREQIGKELGTDLEGVAYRQAYDGWLVADEARRIAQEDPMTKLKRDKAVLEFGIEQQVHERGVGSLSPGDRAIFEGGRKGTTVNIANQLDLQKPTRGFIEKELINSQSVMTLVDSFDEAFFEPGYEMMSSADEFQLTLKDRNGLISDTEKDRLGRYQTQRSAMAGLNANVINRFIGKQQSGKELEHLGDLILKLSNGKTRTAAAAAEFREQVGLGMFRYETILESGSIVDPRFAMSLGNTRNAVKAAMIAHQAELEKTMSEADAAQQLRVDFKNRYGLDVDRIAGNR